MEMQTVGLSASALTLFGRIGPDRRFSVPLPDDCLPKVNLFAAGSGGDFSLAAGPHLVIRARFVASTATV
jgi:hypothetical protein